MSEVVLIWWQGLRPILERTEGFEGGDERPGSYWKDPFGD